MRFSRRGFVTSTLAASGALLLPAAASGSERRLDNLFIIARSTNANIVRYDVRLVRGSELDVKEPLTAYWIMLAEDGRRESLTWLEERMAYGARVVSKVRPSGFRMQLVAFPERTLTVRASDDGWRAECTIAGRGAILDKVFVKVSGGTPPGVDYIDLHGSDAESGKRLRERISRD